MFFWFHRSLSVPRSSCLLWCQNTNNCLTKHHSLSLGFSPVSISFFLSRPVLSDVLPHMCFSSFACTCHIFSPFFALFYYSHFCKNFHFAFFCLSSLAWCLFISKKSKFDIYFCPYPCSSTYRRARLPTDRHRRHSRVKTNDIEFLGEWVRASRCTKHKNLVRPTS